MIVWMIEWWEGVEKAFNKYKKYSFDSTKYVLEQTNSGMHKNKKIKFRFFYVYRVSDVFFVYVCKCNYCI